jgi:TPR repeat protein
MEMIKNSWSQFAFLVLFLACHASLGFAAPEARPEAERADAAQKDGQRAISAEALFAGMLVNAENGQSQAMLNVGTLYEQGIGVPRNFTKALEWYRKAADAGENEAYMRLGLCWEIGMGATADMGKAVAAFEKAAALSHAPAQHKLAGLYLNGRGLPKDEAKGFDLLFKAAEAGESAAAFDLGQVLFAGGFGRKADPEKARTWMLKAAEAGHPGAVLSIASMRKEGIGGKVDLKGSLLWYLIAQKGGVRADGLEAAVTELKAKLSASQTQEAEKAADAWIAKAAEARKQRNPAARKGPALP